MFVPSPTELRIVKDDVIAEGKYIKLKQIRQADKKTNFMVRKISFNWPERDETSHSSHGPWSFLTSVAKHYKKPEIIRDEGVLETYAEIERRRKQSRD